MTLNETIVVLQNLVSENPLAGEMQVVINGNDHNVSFLSVEVQKNVNYYNGFNNDKYPLAVLIN